MGAYGESNEELIQHLNAYSFGAPAPREEYDSADDTASTSYCSSRYGSFSSAAGSESSATSANFSDVGSLGCASLVDYPQGFHADSRRESCASGILAASFSGLDVGSPPGAATFSSPDVRAADASLSPQHDQDSAASSAYPSPGSTVSPGGSPRIQEPVPQGIPISKSSELAYALEVKQEEVRGCCSDTSFLGTGNGLVKDEGSMGSVQSGSYDQAGTSFETEGRVSSAPASDSSSESYEFVPRPQKFSMETNGGDHYSPSTYPEADGYTDGDALLFYYLGAVTCL
ncbi:hypothetical protein OE88DRAFT_1152296 [Heliocybe sulcata]|uniref:Uncharacterized protein n=1 Tax=Heliocybe sulcata TaxID=5364 RepID=A0A5C3NCH0_9AGAM|nr:hypothetical protein OE88DRAFT_1152296 [Heliocybe sulcata]